MFGAVSLKRLRKQISDNTLSIGATTLFAFVMAALAMSRNGWVAGATMFFAGIAWIAMLTALNVAAQMASPGWVKARALAVYLLVFQGAMTGGSILWGFIAARIDITSALLIAAAGQIGALGLAFVFRLPASDAVDLTPSLHWAEPVVAVPPSGDQGPVLIEIEYRVSPEQTKAFVAALHRFKSVRYRDGAIRWNTWEDAAQPGVIVEAFVVESWLEHQRQHARVTNADRIDQSLLNAFHIGSMPPVVRHLLQAR